ncbi:MAG: DUF29 domain-containing protein [Hormoscilla sp. GM102CHS1]|nr:DUF29 domain-containing protein [Hormoscilla sp. GM102CHS1]
MATQLQARQKSLYETDFVRWVETTVAQLRAQNYSRVDWTNLIEEIEDMSRRERKSLKSNLIVILLHLLKWQYEPDYRSGSWRGSIREHRRRIQDDLKDSPSLRPYLQEIFEECYENARSRAADETGLALSTFPADCHYTSEHCLDYDFLPE